MSVTPLNTSSVDALLALMEFTPEDESIMPTFEQCQEWDAWEDNQKVYPTGDPCGVSYGYTQGKPFGEGMVPYEKPCGETGYLYKQLRVMVYWPEIQEIGSWPLSALTQA